MSDARPELHLRHVILPWAQPDSHADEAEAAASARVRDDARAVNIRRDRLAVRGRGERDLPERSRSPGHQDGMPPLLPVTLPFRPHPSIPETDRRTLDSRALMSLAVALDVLATLSRQVEGGDTVLADLTAALLQVGTLGGIDSKAEERLLSYAASRAGQIRATLSRQVASSMRAQPMAAAEVTGTGVTVAVLSTPRAVSRAVRRIEAATDVVLREARLRLEAQEKGTEYRQA
jgi:hypothetical protein